MKRLIELVSDVGQSIVFAIAGVVFLCGVGLVTLFGYLMELQSKDREIQKSLRSRGKWYDVPRQD